uniref:Reverse transcriptase zinc-binding domain-containing protein n=1 Tax=Aegilops tauschii subsp. strangulata TaxID=200361 RepID=A0A453LM54_AEGTS
MHKGKFQTLQSRLSKRLVDWSERYMASSSKEILIKSVAKAIPTYVMSVFKLSYSMCDDLTRMIFLERRRTDASGFKLIKPQRQRETSHNTTPQAYPACLTRMMRQYWWGVENGRRKMAWVSWDKLVLPKQKGGLDFRDMRAFNQALLAKQAWRLIDQPDSLCARLLRARYYRNGNLGDTVFSGNASAVWRGIEHGLELLKKGIIWRVGNGILIRTWRDPWIPRGPSFRPITPKRHCRLNRVSDFLDIHGVWRLGLLQQHFLPADVVAIPKIRTSPHGSSRTSSHGNQIPKCCSVSVVRTS